MEMYDALSIKNSSYKDLYEIEEALKLVQFKIDSCIEAYNHKNQENNFMALQRISHINSDSFQRSIESARNSLAENDQSSSQIFPFEKRSFSDK
jgi:hypothetical protein